MCLWALRDNGYDELYIRSSLIDRKGLFTCKNLPSDTVLYQIYNRNSISKEDLLREIGMLDNRGGCLSDDEKLKFINHSCSPNTILTEYGHLISKNFIIAETELCIDYSTLVTDPEWEMNCLCGEINCREKICASVHC